MSFLRPSRAKQTTVTTGTGTLTLIANAGETRSLQAPLGTGPVKCRYMISGNGYFEHGRGTFTAPSTLTRDEVINSSNSDNLVNIPPGTSDVFLPDYAEFLLDKFSATPKTLTNKDASNTLVFTGSSNAVVNLPASATALPDYWNCFRNDGTANITFTPNGADTIETAASLAVAPGESGYLYLDGTNWKVLGMASPVRNSWTPTDASGAGLTFSSVNCFYTKIGKLVFVEGSLIFPSTADVTAATLGGLPFTSANVGNGFLLSAYAPGGGALALSALVNANAKTINFYDFGGSARTNANMATRTLYFSGFYYAA